MTGELETPKDGGAGFHDVVTVEFFDPREDVCGFLRIVRSPAEGRSPVIAVLCANGESIVELSEPGAGRTIAGWEQAESGPGRMTIEQPLERWTAKLTHEGDGFEVELVATTPPVELAGDGPVGHATGTHQYEQLCRVTGTARVNGQSRNLNCTGRRVHAWGSPDWDAIDSRRSLHLMTADGAGISILVGRPAGASGHDDDVIGGRFFDGETEPLPAEELLLSTVYDENRQPTSASVELLVPGEELSHRATGEAICKATIDAEGREHRLSFFRWSLDGRPGWGSYAIVSASGQE